MTLTPITTVFLVGALCASILDETLAAAFFMLAALINTLLMMWALSEEQA